mmetsp:Transcript_46010/g.109308  ORF Transcript_46010/g.109308 Transcript_46010/m.109308 type:complete len:249 (+) Transcript_46010:657-1403(+)
MASVERVPCTSARAATHKISAPCFRNFRSFASAPLVSSWRKVLISLVTKRSTKSRRMFKAGCALTFRAFSPTISSLDFLAFSHKRTVLSCTSMRNFLMRSLGGRRFFSSSSSFSFCFFASSSSGSSTSSFLSSPPSSFSISVRRSFISWSSWNFSGSPPLSGWSSKAIFLYMALMSFCPESGGRPKKASADRFCKLRRLAFTESRHFWMRPTSSSVSSIPQASMCSSNSSVLMAISLATQSASNVPSR